MLTYLTLIFINLYSLQRVSDNPANQWSWPLKRQSSDILNILTIHGDVAIQHKHTMYELLQNDLLLIHSNNPYPLPPKKTNPKNMTRTQNY